MPCRIAIWLALVVSAGCTSQSVRRQTEAQADTFIDIHYRQVMDNLAMVADDPEVLPSYSMLDFGTADVTDKVAITGSVVAPPPRVATTALIDPSVSRTVKENWTLTPVVAPEKLRATAPGFPLRGHRRPEPAHLPRPPRHARGVSLSRDAGLHPGHQPAAGLQSVPMLLPRRTGLLLRRERRSAQHAAVLAEGRSRRGGPEGRVLSGSVRKDARMGRQRRHRGSLAVHADRQPHFPLERRRRIFSQTESRLHVQGVGPCVLVRARHRTRHRVTHGATRPRKITLPVDCYGNIVPPKIRDEGIATTDKKLLSSLSASLKSP